MRRTDLHRMHPVRTFAWLAFNLPPLLSLLLLKLELLDEFDGDNIPYDHLLTSTSFPPSEKPAM